MKAPLTAEENRPIDEYQELRYIGLTHEHVSEVLEWKNAKVLEALEREVPKAYIDGYSKCASELLEVAETKDRSKAFLSVGKAQDYYQNEVKPKYD